MKKILIILLYIIILFNLLLILNKNFSTNTSDDFIFIKKIRNINKQEEIENQYKFDIKYKNIDFKSINLASTTNKKTLVDEKIAPGTNGKFDIILNSNFNLKYIVNFKDINEKPKNLKFKIYVNDIFLSQKDSLETLTGTINKNQTIKITVDWYWNYENENEKDINQDTIDSKNIREYKFDIYTLGEELV